MESPVVVDKPPEYHGNKNERGFPFDEEEGSGAWSELAARHPDIAARLRQRPATATWARKRRPSSQDAEDFGDNFGAFDRFPFDDIPPEFREHFPSHWNRRFGPREETQPQQPPPQSPQQQTAATQTEQTEPDAPPPRHNPLPQYGLRNTVDLGQKSAADPSLVDADERTHRSVSAPPDSRPRMSAPGHEPAHEPATVRHIPIFVEGRDEPVINRNVDHGAHYEAKPPPPPQPHIDREQYFADEGPVGFHHTPNFSRAFGSPFGQNYRQGPQPFTQQKAYPQNTAFARGASPQRSQSPKPQQQDEPFVKIPVHHDQNARAPPRQAPQQQQPRQAPQQQQPRQAPQQQPPRQSPQQPPQQQPPPQTQQRQQTPEPKPQPQCNANDPITQIVSIQTDVLNLMSEVENFTGVKKDKKYLFLDEMLTRNLIKLDNIETDGKENIRQARKEAIRCIQKCIAVLEAKAEQNAPQPQPADVAPQEPASVKEGTPQPQDVVMASQEEKAEVKENGEVDMKEAPREEAKVEPTEQPATPQPEPVQAQPANEQTDKPENKDATPAQPDKQPDEQPDEKEKKLPKKGTKIVKKRDKSKDKDSNKEEKLPVDKDNKDNKASDAMQVDEKAENKPENQMEVDALGASQ